MGFSRAWITAAALLAACEGAEGDDVGAVEARSEANRSASVEVTADTQGVTVYTPPPADSPAAAPVDSVPAAP